MSKTSTESEQPSLRDMISGQWFHSVGLDFENQLFLTVHPDNPHIGVSPDFIDGLARNNITYYISRGRLTLNADGSGSETILTTINLAVHPDVIKHYELSADAELTIETTTSTDFTWEVGERQGYKTLIYHLQDHHTKTTDLLIDNKNAEETLLNAPLKDITFEFRQEMVRIIIEDLSQRFAQESSDVEEDSIMLKYIRDARHDSLVVDTGVIIYEMTREELPMTP